MKPLSKLSAAITTAIALNACATSHPAESPESAADTVRSNIDVALSQIGTDRQGIQAGPNPKMLYSVSCGKGLIEDQTRLDTRIDAMGKLISHACPDDPDAYVPILDAGNGQAADTICVRVMTPTTITCHGRERTLKVSE